MALSTFILDSRATKRLVKQTDADTTADNDVVGKAPTIYALHIVNTAGGANTAYIKLYDAKSADNTIHPDMNIRVAANQTVGLNFPDGLVFSTGLCLRGAQQANDVGVSSTNPAADVVVTILTN
tara:strand:- start:1330 stop:1701 length:372 start_codon:yes stop_codon:yes gene_type:complete